MPKCAAAALAAPMSGDTGIYQRPQRRYLEVLTLLARGTYFENAALPPPYSARRRRLIRLFRALLLYFATAAAACRRPALRG